RRHIRTHKRVRTLTQACQILRHGNDARPRRLVYELRQPKAADPADFPQCDSPLMLKGIRHTLLQRRNHRGPVVTLDCEYERKSEFLCVCRVERLQLGKLFRCTRSQPRALLLPGGLWSELAAQGCSSRQLWMCPDQAELLGNACTL